MTYVQMIHKKSDKKIQAELVAQPGDNMRMKKQKPSTKGLFVL
jgi:hypothetical protein